LEEETARPLMRLCGLMIAGPPDGEAVSGAKLAARLHGVPLEEVSPDDAAERFPGFRIPDSSAGVYEPEAGYLQVENCVRSDVEGGGAHGRRGRLRSKSARSRSASSRCRAAGRVSRVMSSRSRPAFSAAQRVHVYADARSAFHCRYPSTFSRRRIRRRIFGTR